jgi:hypothetical protein
VGVLTLTIGRTELEWRAPHMVSYQAAHLLAANVKLVGMPRPHAAAVGNGKLLRHSLQRHPLPIINRLKSPVQIPHVLLLIKRNYRDE